MKKILRIFCVLPVIILSLSASSVSAGEVININHEQQIVFTDLTSKVLKPGDRVQAGYAADGPVTLVVEEASSVLSRLVPFDAESQQRFMLIRVGSPVELMEGAEIVSELVMPVPTKEMPQPVVPTIERPVKKISPPVIQQLVSPQPVVQAQAYAPPPVVTCDTTEIEKIESKNQDLKQRLEKMIQSHVQLTDNMAAIVGPCERFKKESEMHQQRQEEYDQKIILLNQKVAALEREAEQKKKLVDQMQREKNKDKVVIKELNQKINQLKDKLNVMVGLVNQGINVNE